VVFEYLHRRAAALADEARALLGSEPRSAASRALDAAIDYAVKRVY